MRIFGLTVACLFVCIGSTGNQIPKSNSEYYKIHDSVEEYFVEHAISTTQAKEALKEFHLNNVQPKAGCQQCTRQEIRYCLGLQLINDHCCCDRKYTEFFPYVPHTCYIGEKLCKPLAKDCAEYTRLRTCCCDNYVLQKWKMSNGPKNIINYILILNLILIANFIT